jgi:hypothetical protein
MTEYFVDLKEARDTLGQILLAATHGGRRYVIRRYGKEIGFIGGVAELSAQRERDKAAKRPASAR